MFVQTNKIDELLSYFKKKLSGQYSEREIENIFYLLCDYKLNLSRLEASSGSRLLSEAELLLFNSALKRLQQKEPVQHIIGEVEFYGCRVLVGPEVLVPRPETEELTDTALKLIDQTSNVLDVGTGSGCIAIGIQKKSGASVTAIDVSSDALRLARQSAELNDVAIEFIQGDIMVSSDVPSGTFDLIISNPPYIPAKERSSLDANVLGNDPDTALFVPDEDPLKFYRRIYELGESLLADDGAICFEIHEDFGAKMLALAKEIGYTSTELLQDLQGKDRFVISKK